MPKTIESRLVIKSEFQDQAAPKLSKLEQQLDRVISKTDQAERGGGRGFFRPRDERGRFIPMAGAGGYGGGGATGGYGGGSPRSPHAPPPVVGVRAGGAGGPVAGSPRGGGAPPPPDNRFERGIGRFGRRAGMAMGVGSEILAGITHQITPAVGGLMTATGGALMGNLITALPGLGLMAGGAMMTGASILAQPALQHYGQFADTYRLLGKKRSDELMEEAKGAFAPDETMRYAGQLHAIGATEAFGRMGKMRFGEAAPEQLMKYFATTTQTGAAGRMQKNDYDYLAKVFSGGIAKDRGKVSMEQSIDTMTGLMQSSVQYLGNLTKDQARELTVITAGMEGQRTSALLRGPMGVATMGGMMAVAGGEGGEAQEMFKYQAYMKRNPRGNYMGYLRWKPTAGAVLDLMEDFGEMGDEGAIGGMRMFHKTLPAFENIAAGFKAGAISRKEADRRIKAAEAQEAPEYKATGEKFDTFTKERAIQQTRQFEISKDYVDHYLKMETTLLEGLQNVLKATEFDVAVGKFVAGVDYMVHKMGGSGTAPGEAKTLGEAVGRTSPRSLLKQLKEELGVGPPPPQGVVKR